MEEDIHKTHIPWKQQDTSTTYYFDIIAEKELSLADQAIYRNKVLPNGKDWNLRKLCRDSDYLCRVSLTEEGLNGRWFSPVWSWPDGQTAYDKLELKTDKNPSKKARIKITAGAIIASGKLMDSDLQQIYVFDPHYVAILEITDI